MRPRSPIILLSAILLVAPVPAAFSQDAAPQSSFNITDPAQASDPVAKLELKLFDHTYKSDSQESRVKRLETFVFGTSQTGQLNDRITKLQQNVSATEPASASATSGSGGVGAAGGQAPATNQAARQTFDDTDYPRVDQLERQILGQPHSHEILSGRLERLETKAFGHPSQSTDPADRVDALEAYATRHDLYGGGAGVGGGNQQAQSYGATVPFTPYQSPYGSNGSYGSAAPSAVPYGQDTMAYAPTRPNPYLQANVTSTNDRLSAMEKTEFGRDYPSHSLKDRVQKLEKKVLTNKHQNDGLTLPARVDQLWSIVSVSNSMGNAPIASNAQSQNSQNKSHHSIMHGVGKVLGAAAMAGGAAGMMMSRTGMGYGMGGMGYGMNPYSYGGMGNYNYGGYGNGMGSYGYGGLGGLGGYGNSYGRMW